jgi:hypothetical protein
MSGRFHGASLNFYTNPVVLRPTELNFGLFPKNRPNLPPNYATSVGFAGFRVNLADFAAVVLYIAGRAMFEPSVYSNE